MGDNIVGGPRQQRMLISRRGGPEELTLMDEPMPSPVRISFAYASLRQGSLVPMCEGLYTGIPSYPFAPGHDVVGEIDAFGPGAGAGLLAGQRVEALTLQLRAATFALLLCLRTIAYPYPTWCYTNGHEELPLVPLSIFCQPIEEAKI
jgi:NADPH:quinone reductase-like Zn-dependent oxidoreductase